MPTIFRDPVGWSAMAVATKPRYWFMVAMMVVMPFFLVFVAITGGWRAATGLAIFLAVYQFMFLFALRRLYLRTDGSSVDRTAV